MICKQSINIKRIVGVDTVTYVINFLLLLRVNLKALGDTLASFDYKYPKNLYIAAPFKVFIK